MGTGCDWGRTFIRSADSTLTPRGALSAYASETCTKCHCVPRAYPIAACEATIVPTRAAFIEDVHSGSHGIGSRLNGMLSVLPYAISNGYGFQLSSLTCPSIENRTQPHCFFQPVSSCGSATRHVVTDIDSLNAAEDASWQASARTRSLACQRLGGTAVECRDPLQAWRAMARVALRLQPEVDAYVQESFLDATRAWSDGPYGACHIRRTDKVSGATREAVAVPVCAYADQLSRLAGASAAGLNVFVATDDLTTAAELEACPTAVAHDWTVRHFHGTPQRDGYPAQCRLWAESMLLVQAEWVVGTLTSNIGRLVQMRRSQPAETFFSIDTPNGGWDWDLRGPR